MKQVFIALGLTILFIIVLGLWFKKSNMQVATITSKPSTISSTVTVNGKLINVVVARSDSERSKGLSGQTSLDSESGMLFVFTEGSDSPIFWMKDMLIPIDIIWIKNDKIVRIDKNISAPEKNTPESSLTKYSAGTPIDYVLEVNAGFSETNSVKVGDTVTFSGI